MNQETMQFLKECKQYLNKPIYEVDWEKVYELAAYKFESRLGKFTEFWLRKNIHPENYLLDLPKHFLRNIKIAAFEIPYNIRSIGDYAFRYCRSLTTVTIPTGVTSIGNYVFQGCRSLISITIPNSVTSIGAHAFADCHSLTSMTIPDSITSISDHVFGGCMRLTNIKIPNGVTMIGDYVFAGCNHLTSITIPDSVISIGVGAFERCGDNLVIKYNGTKAQFKTLLRGDLTNIYFMAHCTDGDIVKKRK